MSWIDRRLGEGDQGRGEVNRHVMATYGWPLKVYFLGTRDRWVGEPDEVINGFFADRLSRPAFFHDWRKSGLKLRHWLINAFCFYLRELKRSRMRAQPDASPPADLPVSAAETKAYDRAFIASVVRQALLAAGAACEREGKAVHWQVFMSHFCQGRPYDQFVGDLGVDAARAVVMARTARKRFQSALRDLVAHDAADADVDAEIRSLLEAT